MFVGAGLLLRKSQPKCFCYAKAGWGYAPAKEGWGYAPAKEGWGYAPAKEYVGRGVAPPRTRFDRELPRGKSAS